MRDMVGAGAKHRISEIQAAQDGRVAMAVKEALAEAREAAQRSEAATVQASVAEAVEECETRMLSRQTVIEQQLIAAKKEFEARLAEMYTEEKVQALLQRTEEAAKQSNEKEVREAVRRSEEKAALERQKALESVNEKIRTSVREREKELLAENGKGLQDLAEAELKEASKYVRSAGKQAAAQWGSGNDDFEEAVLKKTAPAPLVNTLVPEEPKATVVKPLQNAADLEDELVVEQAISSASARKKDRDLAKAEKAKAEKPAKSSTAADGDADGEYMVAPPLEYLRMKARHKAEEEALLTRQTADEYRAEELDDDDDGGSRVESRREGRKKRAAEKEELKARQVKEAMAAGSALAYSARAQKAIDDNLQINDPLDVFQIKSESEEDIRRRMAEHPELQLALDKVDMLEKRLIDLQATGEIRVTVDRSDTRIACDNMQTILQEAPAKQKGITDAERASLQEVMDLLHFHMKRDQTMKAMVEDIEDEVTADGAAQETASCVQQDVSREEDQMGALASQLQELMARDSNAKLNEDDLALLRQLTLELKSQQEQAEMREAQISWLKAESRRARLTAVLEARAELERQHEDALQADLLIVPTTPIAAPEDAFSVAIDWVPPIAGTAVRYHLQWRNEDDREWASSAASEKINVPCCTKGHLRTQLAYQFRVRAADKEGRWGPWSKPTEPTQPSVLLNNIPSRPQLRPLTKGRVEARWSPPEGVDPSSYELEWRRCDGDWGELDSSMPCNDVVATSPSLLVANNAYYTFRVRATIKRYTSTQQTEWSPPSAPVLPFLKRPDEAKAKVDAKAKVAQKERPPAPPVRRDEDATESVIEADLRGVMADYHPTAQAAAEATLANVTKQRSQDESNLKTLEDRNRAIVSKSREEQLNELVRMKREMLSRAADSDEPIARPMDAAAAAEATQPTATATDSWD